MLREFVCIGDKIDIRFVQQMETKEELPEVYRCQLTAVTEDGKLELSMPVENDRTMILPLDTRYIFIFYTKSGQYSGIGQIIERYKKENTGIFLAELHSQLKKIQPREYYHYPCQLDAWVYPVSKEDVYTKTAEQLFASVRDAQFQKKKRKVSVRDLGGDGVYLLSNEKFTSDSYILLVLGILDENPDRFVFVAGYVENAENVEDADEKFESHVQFVFKNNQSREKIIHYIFEAEQKYRRAN